MSFDGAKIKKEKVPNTLPAASRESKPEKKLTKAQRRLVEHLLYMMLLLILSSFFTMQIREGISVQKQLSSSNEERLAYQQQLKDLETENQILKEQNTLLAEKKDMLTENVLNEQGYSELASELAEIRELAGLTSVDGDGVTITLSDSTITDTSDTNQSSLIHSQDVQYIVDLLKSAGASAIAINGERIVCTTSIVCTGPTIRVNNSRYPVPYVITAVCDPDSTYDILQNDVQILFRLSEGVEVSFEKSADLSIPAFSDSTIVDALSEELEVVSPS